MFPKSPGEGPLGFELDGHLDDLGSFWGHFGVKLYRLINLGRLESEVLEF